MLGAVHDRGRDGCGDEADEDQDGACYAALGFGVAVWCEDLG